MAPSILMTYRMHARALPIQACVFSTCFRCAKLIVVVDFSQASRMIA
jgi:hypothetical protein